ncbi:MAG: D-alanine--D-alanine ligase family protein [Parcubacteria group bacterium]
MPNKKTIAVIFGGKSAEHDVSIITAHIPIINALKVADKYNVLPVYIAKDGRWYSESSMNDLDYFKRADYEDRLTGDKLVDISLNGGFKIIHRGLFSKSIPIDIVFTAMHGTFGEDGSLMGMLRMANVPFVGCDMSASAVAMDKIFTKQIIAAEGIPVVPFVWFTRYDWEKMPDECLSEAKKLNWPLFVKPPHLGSSIGMAKVRDEKGLRDAIEVALHYDSKVLIEESVENLIEVTLPIIGDDEPQLGAIERPLNKSDFFDFEEKYLSQGKKTGLSQGSYSEIPAKIAPDLAREVETLGKKTYRALGCSGMARIDFLINEKSNNVFVNEVNPLPGSLYHHNFKTIGISDIDLVNRLIAFAEERFTEERKLTRTFKSEILNKIRGGKKGEN